MPFTFNAIISTVINIIEAFDIHFSLVILFWLMALRIVSRVILMFFTFSRGETHYYWALRYNIYAADFEEILPCQSWRFSFSRWHYYTARFIMKMSDTMHYFLSIVTLPACHLFYLCLIKALPLPKWKISRKNNSHATPTAFLGK